MVPTNGCTFCAPATTISRGKRGGWNQPQRSCVLFIPQGTCNGAFRTKKSVKTRHSFSSSDRTVDSRRLGRKTRSPGERNSDQASRLNVPLAIAMARWCAGLAIVLALVSTPVHAITSVQFSTTAKATSAAGVVLEAGSTTIFATTFATTAVAASSTTTTAEPDVAVASTTTTAEPDIAPAGPCADTSPSCTGQRQFCGLGLGLRVGALPFEEACRVTCRTCDIMPTTFQLATTTVEPTTTTTTVTTTTTTATTTTTTTTTTYKLSSCYDLEEDTLCGNAYDVEDCNLKLVKDACPVMCGLCTSTTTTTATTKR